MKRTTFCFVLTLILCALSDLLMAQNTAPEVSIEQVSVNETAKTVTINYQLMDLENDPCEVWVKVSVNFEEYFEMVDPDDLSGDVGAGILPGVGRTVVWNYESLPVSVYSTRVGVYASDGQEVMIQPMVNQVDSLELLKNLTWIEGIRHYNANPGHLNEVRDSLENIFLRHQLQTERQLFPYGNVQGINIVGRKPGLRDESVTYIVSGHYDGVPNSPGADDNGSAVSGMLEILRVASMYRFEHSVVFIGFDLEEYGLLGSKRFVQHDVKPYEDIQGVLNFEMIGYYDETPYSQTIPPGFEILFPQQVQEILADSSRANFLLVVGNTNSNPLITSFMDAAAQYVPELKTISLSVPGNGTIAPDLRRSDHASFWDAGKKALMITDGADSRNFNYHTPGDSIGTLNFTFMEKNVKSTLATLALLAVPVHAGYGTYDLSQVAIPGSDTKGDRELSLYPNPAKELLTVKFGCFIGEPTQIEIRDQEGRTVQSHPVSCDGRDMEVTLSLSGIAAGGYFVVVRSGDRIIARKVFRI